VCVRPASIHEQRDWSTITAGLEDRDICPRNPWVCADCEELWVKAVAGGQHREHSCNAPGPGTAGKKLVGGVGVSGDTSCADHNIAWRVRNLLGLDHLSGVGGVSGDAARPDNIIFDIAPNPSGGTGISAGGFGHPTCLNTFGSDSLPPVQP